MSRTLDNVRQLDVQKLHLESLQLRNQQFLLATVSFAGSGVTAWIAPTLTGLLTGTVPELALVVATLFWLGLLTVLYIWSLSLRTLISVISQYLDVSGASDWEGHYRAFTRQTEGRMHLQTGFTAKIFAVYGVIAVGGGFTAALTTPDRVHLSTYGFALLSACLGIYIAFVFREYGRRNQNERVRQVWRELLVPEGMINPGQDTA